MIHINLVPGAKKKKASSKPSFNFASVGAGLSGRVKDKLLIGAVVSVVLAVLAVGYLYTSQIAFAGELEELGYHVTQSMVSRYEQGLLDAPLTLERMVGWALCCEAHSSRAFRELLALAGYYLPWNATDLRAFDDLLRSYRRVSLTDQVVLRGRLLWHILGISAESAVAR